MSASGGKASGAAHGQMSLKGLKNCGPTRRIEPKTQEIKGDSHLPWPAANYSDLIKGAVGDTVDLASSANTADWTQAGTLTYNTTIYDVWNHDLSRATIYIQQGVLVA